MASRFAYISDEEVKEFTEKLENENTKKKTLYDIKVFKEYLDACDEKREIEEITPVELTYACTLRGNNYNAPLSYPVASSFLLSGVWGLHDLHH